jgi:hypothetical protein
MTASRQRLKARPRLWRGPFSLDKKRLGFKSRGVTFKNPGLAKRKKEIARNQWQKEKAERRAQRQKEKPKSELEGEDPDIAGIVPGPQPIPSEEGEGGGAPPDGGAE